MPSLLEGMMSEVVQVGDQSVAIEVAQSTKNFWKVSGTFRGALITVSAAERRTAVNRWRKAAENKIGASPLHQR